MSDFVKNVAKWIIFALPAVALIVPTNMFFPFITGKAFAFRVAVELVFALYVALAFSDKSLRPRWNALNIAFAFFVIIMFLADSFSINPSKAFWSNFERMDGFVTLAHLFLYFISTSSLLSSKKDWHFWLLSSIAISVYMVFFCFLQLSGEVLINQGGVRVDGALGNAAYLAAYLIFQFFFLAYLWVSEEADFAGIGGAIMVGGFGYSLYYLIRIAQPGTTHTSYGFIILAVAFLTALVSICLRLSSKVMSRYRGVSFHVSSAVLALAYLVVLYHTATRGAILGLLGGVLIGSVYLAVKGRHLKIVRNSSLALLLILALLSGGFYIARDSAYVKNSPVLSRFASLSLNTKGQARNYIWPMAIEGFKERPILGWGQEGFNYVFQKYYNPQLVNQEPFFDRAHNSFLDWLVAGGVLGFLCYISLYVIALIFIIRNSIFSIKEKAVLFALLFAYTFQNIFIFDNLISYLFFAGFLAFVSARYNSHSDHTQSPINASVLTSCLAAFVVISLLVNAKGYLQNVTLIKGITEQKIGISENLALIQKAIKYNSLGTSEVREQLVRISFQVISAPNAPDEAKISFANSAVDEMNKQIKETPKDVRIYLGFGDFLVSIGAYDQAIPILEQAIELSPKKQQGYYTLAKAYLGKFEQNKDLKDAEKAVSINKEAYDFAPNLDASRLPYATALLLTDHAAEAAKLITELEDPSLIVNIGIIEILVNKGFAGTVETMLKREIARNSRNAEAYIMLSNVYVSLKDQSKAIKALEDLKTAVPEQAAEADKDIEAVKAHFK